ncbi:hypothetical protein AAF712_012213 [Marasmius tenuissimus]|uniref:Uncharacterized protein n=1 Tax=Marasmius tenuissimus TaxID=585030 RepID=A0ABR2ZIB2_9AGAR
MATTIARTSKSKTQVSSSSSKTKTPSAVPPRSSAQTAIPSGSSRVVDNSSSNIMHNTIESTLEPSVSSKAASETSKKNHNSSQNKEFATPLSQNSLFGQDSAVVDASYILDEINRAAIRRGKLPMSTLRLGTTVIPESEDESNANETQPEATSNADELRPEDSVFSETPFAIRAQH